jgi:hypothetical protein
LNRPGVDAEAIAAALLELARTPDGARTILSVFTTAGTTVAEGSALPREYGSHCHAERPKGWAFRKWQEAIKGIQGAKRRGRYWFVSREAFERWEAAQVAPAPASTPTTWADEARAAGGIRTSRASR